MCIIRRGKEGPSRVQAYAIQEVFLRLVSLAGVFIWKRYGIYDYNY